MKWKYWKRNRSSLPRLLWKIWKISKNLLENYLLERSFLPIDGAFLHVFMTWQTIMLFLNGESLSCRLLFVNFAKFTGKNLCQSLFFLLPGTLLKKRLWRRSFPVNVSKLLRYQLYGTPKDDYIWPLQERAL